MPKDADRGASGTDLSFDAEGPGEGPASPTSLNWGFIGRRVAVVTLVLLFLWTDSFPFVAYVLIDDGGRLFGDSHIYFRATAAWLDGVSPWVATWFGWPFAGPPPSLLITLPLQPLGETLAVAVIVIGNTVSVIYLLRRFALPVWWILFPPIAEGWLGGSPDLSLAALAFAGLGLPAAVGKVYAVPPLLAAGRWRAVLLAGVVVVGSIPVLPWRQFFESTSIITDAFANFANPVSAYGVPLLMVATALALLTFRWRDALSLSVPGLLAQQPHYVVFSLDVIARSPILVVALALPFNHLAAVGIVVWAVGRAAARRFQLGPLPFLLGRDT